MSRHGSPPRLHCLLDSVVLIGCKDLCKLFTAPKFDQAQADRLVKLYRQAGARYVVPVAAHHDNFDMWDSKFQPRWNSMATAGKDVCGMWQQATVANGLHFGVASHVARSFRWLQTSHGADQTGPLKGVPYDGQDPQDADLYGVPWHSSDPGYEGPQDVGPPAFEKNFEDRMKDLIDRYHPDLYYTDGGPPFKSAGLNGVAHLYNNIDHGSAADIRFTRNKPNTILYATTLGWPGDGAVVKIKTLGKARIDLKSLQSVTLLGSPDKLKFSQDAGSLQITLPAKAPYACNAYPIKLVFADKIPKLKPAARLLWQAQAREIEGAEDCATYGLSADGGVLLVDVPAASDAAKAGLKIGDVLVSCNGKEVKLIADVSAIADQSSGRKLTLTINRQQKLLPIDLIDYTYVVRENLWKPEFKKVPVAEASAILPARVSFFGPGLSKGAADLLVDGKIDCNRGPTFANGVDTGKYMLDLGEAKSIARINTYASGNTHARQSFTLYGSNAADKPCSDAANISVYTPIITVDSRGERTEYEATSIRRSADQPLGSFRWLVWAATPTMGEIGGQNTTFEEMQVLPGQEAK
ncbi:MAG: alpha-L-fucosidase [Verrucomicrobia bacterium]|nr:alpha-L-fucosidase [Verrucomicrobiota bacterium]